MKRIAILGFGREGISVLKTLQAIGAADQAELWVLDANAHTKVPRGIHTQLGANYLSNLERFDTIFRSPGIPYLLPQIQKARRDGAEITSATKLFFHEARALKTPPFIVGITGTKGKGTTATLLYNMLTAARIPAFLGGNIGLSPLELLPKLERTRSGRRPIVVLELSSFQLQDMTDSPDVAIVLDMFPDHQDSHKNLKEYYDAKANIAKFQKPGDKIFFFKDNAVTARTARPGKGKKITVGRSSKLFSPKDLSMPGAHNFRNAVMAAAVAQELGVPAKTIATVAKKFPGNEHRLEFIRTANNVRFYNDSASTNPQTTAAAVQAFPNASKILIAGGKDKNLDYAALAKALKKSGTQLVVLYGENKNKIARAIKYSGVPVIMVRDLKIAIDTAYRARPQVVLFSPGATSFDMFANYADRGRQFKALVKKLKIR